MSDPTSARRLGAASLPTLPAAVARPGYDRTRVTPGIVHLGLGAFGRSHLGVYTDDVLASGATDWGIVGVNLRSPDVVDALKPQDGLYTLLCRENGDDRLRVIGAFLDVLNAATELDAVLRAMAKPEIRVVTITVTEKGYCHDPATGRLNEAHPMVTADLADPMHPRSLPGLIVEALRLRRDAGVPPFTVLSCDNLPQNGRITRAVVTRFAQLRDADLGRYVADGVAFPSSMVDRITPATKEADRAIVNAGLGLDDAWPVVAEPFHQWVIEDRFPGGRPAWEAAGAILTDDVHPFETMKLRCLNGAHSTLAYLSVLGGIETVAEAMADPLLPKVIRQLWDDDIIPTVPPVPGTDVAAYTRDLEERFRNPGIRHLTLQISSDGSQKLGPRLLAPAAERIAVKNAPRVVPLTVAAWMAFLRQGDDQGRAWLVADPMAARLTAIAREHKDDPAALADALFSLGEIFPPAIAGDAPFRKATIQHLRSLLDRGLAATLTAFLFR
ncbi:mannitol dehydrogenase family protein [Pleomorphomonas sp. NRK KF1]|uniref:mannitol dehydrogenase family protein n=1 Tax=Pleomorphomonas sp. NRK KF1 TaxID=2943000 RepID=UPI00204344DD|nr:mannitol dehydrogenase family protein [Pleomorphomonas sp. NRK KF1]MCM5553828.1 mannitol dehydrogenase family protein [Pleomorphomonas sp. NRK KF1]